MRRFYEDLWNAWDDEAVPDVLAPDFAFRGSLGVETVGREAWRGYRDSVRAGSRDFHNELVGVVVDGDRAAVRLRYSGTHTGPLLGLPATWRPFTYDGAAFFSQDAGLLTSTWALGDLEGLWRQLAGSQHPRP